MVFLMFVMFLTGIHLDDWIGSVLFFVLAATFGMIYLLRKMRWALIVTYIMFFMGFVPLLGQSAHPEYTGVLILAAVSLPFFVVYFSDPKQNGGLSSLQGSTYRQPLQLWQRLHLIKHPS